MNEEGGKGGVGRRGRGRGKSVGFKHPARAP